MPVVIDNIKKAEILFEYGSIKNYLKDYFNETDYDELCIQDVFNTKKETIEPYLIKSNWEEDKNKYLAFGYTKDDIIYEDYDEAYADLKDTFIEDLAILLDGMFFGGNSDMIKYLTEYIEECL